MKKQTMLLAAMALLLALTACGKTETEPEEETLGGDLVATIPNGSTEGIQIPEAPAPFDYQNADLSAYVQVSEYKNVPVTMESAVLTDEEFENEIRAMLENYSYYEEYTDRAVQEGDRVRADYAGSLDGVLFEGGTAKDAELTAAPDTGYIPGFAEAFIGQMPGVEFSFPVTFPADYGQPDLAGKEVTFTCTVHAILGEALIVPELTDAFVKENFNYNNVEEFRIAFRASTEKQKEYYVESNMYSQLWLYIVDHAEILKYPEEEVNRIYGEQRKMYEGYAEYFGTDYDSFIADYLNTTDAKLKEESRRFVREDLVMYRLIEELDIDLTPEEYAKGLAFFAEYNGMTESELVEYYGKDTIWTTVLWQKLMEVLAEDAIITEAEG